MADGIADWTVVGARAGALGWSVVPTEGGWAWLAFGPNGSAEGVAPTGDAAADCAVAYMQNLKRPRAVED